MRIEFAPRGSACTALLDDMSGDASDSRLYIGHICTLSIMDSAAASSMLDEVQRLIAIGLHAVGVFTYELGARMQSIGIRGEAGPLAQVLLFRECRKLSKSEVSQWLHTQADSANAGVANVRANVTQAQFESAVAQVKAYIAAGDTYQVNYTMRIDFDAYGHPAALYTRLRERQRVPYGAFIVMPDGTSVLSLSPELFLRHTAGDVIARPMKGTAPAGGHDDGGTLRRAQALSADPKNRAENVMIVDLLRNDLGRIAKIGTVRVPELFDVARFGGVLQMTSTVRATLRDDCKLSDVFDAIFPCGSITGAPKRRSMQIIHELEAQPRGLYTGAIGWFDAPMFGRGLGDFCMSVPIRTIVLQPELAGLRSGRMGVGSGIVADSDPTSEFEECQLKAGFLTGLAQELELSETLPRGVCI